MDFFKRIRRQREYHLKDEENPFKLWEMKEQLKCLKCGKTWTVPFKRFDYIFKKVTGEMAKHKSKKDKKECDGEVEVSGIWYEYRDETLEEKRWKEYEKKFK
jgi:hypothetical protein